MHINGKEGFSILNLYDYLDINLFAALEQMLAERVRARQKTSWLTENKEAIAAYNNRVDEQGVFSDGLRSF